MLVIIPQDTQPVKITEHLLIVKRQRKFYFTWYFFGSGSGETRVSCMNLPIRGGIMAILPLKLLFSVSLKGGFSFFSTAAQQQCKNQTITHYKITAMY